MAWGVGWALGSIGLFLAGRELSLRSPLPAFLVALVLGALCFGVPVFLSSRGQVRHPTGEAAIWTFTLAVLVLTFAWSSRPDPSGLNIVTLENMQHRNEYLRTWHYPRELVWFGQGLLSYVVIVGTSVTLLERGVPRDRRAAVRAVLFVVAVMLVLVLALILFVLGLPLLWAFLDLSGAPARFGDVAVIGVAFVAGWLSSVGIGLARRRFVLAQ
jgi:hypothetical protein